MTHVEYLVAVSFLQGLFFRPVFSIPFIYTSRFQKAGLVVVCASAIAILLVGILLLVPFYLFDLWPNKSERFAFPVAFGLGCLCFVGFGVFRKHKVARNA